MILLNITQRWYPASHPHNSIPPLTEWPCLSSTLQLLSLLWSTLRTIKILCRTTGPGSIVHLFVRHRCITAYCTLLKQTSLAKILQYMPLSDRLPAFRKHFVPMFDLHGTALTAENDLSDKFVSAHAVVVHTRYEQRGLSDFFVWHIENKRFVKDRIQSSFFYTRLFLFHFLAVVAHPDLHVWIYKYGKNKIKMNHSHVKSDLHCTEGSMLHFDLF